MAGISKHYVFTAESGNSYWDYTIPAQLLDALVRLAPAFQGSVFEGRIRENTRLSNLIEDIKGWRPKVKALWAARLPGAKKHLRLVEYRVRPGKNRKNCPFRNWMHGNRSFKRKQKNALGYRMVVPNIPPLNPPPPARDPRHDEPREVEVAPDWVNREGMRNFIEFQQAMDLRVAPNGEGRLVAPRGGRRG